MTVVFDLGPHRTVSNSPDLERAGARISGNVDGDILLTLRSIQKGFDFHLVDMVSGHEVKGVSNRNDIFQRADDCRTIWYDNIVCYSRPAPDPAGGLRNDQPFQQRWKLEDEPGLLQEMAPRLALAGDTLFELIFERDGDEGLYKLAATLREWLRRGPRHVFISSDDFFLPWGMLYTHPVPGKQLSSRGKNWKPEGFWGYQHIIQHMTMNHDPIDEKIEPRRENALLSLNLDEGISRRLKLPCIDEHFEYIASLRQIRSIRRTKKSELQKAFTKDVNHLERIIYFYCHGTGAKDEARINLGEAKLSLTEGFVSAADFQKWSGKRGLPTKPLVFINACQGGQMTTMFYKTFAVELLKQGAVGLVGAQVDIPAVFAAEYASRVFCQLFTKGEQVRLGRELRDINRDLWKHHKNPLGVVYSLYRGVNCFIDWPSR
jgi:hypothetical protein